MKYGPKTCSYWSYNLDAPHCVAQKVESEKTPSLLWGVHGCMGPHAGPGKRDRTGDPGIFIRSPKDREGSNFWHLAPCHSIEDDQAKQ